MTASTGSTWKRTWVLSLAGLLALSLSMPAVAATINVPSDQTTIQDAVNAASPGDEVTLDDGTYAESVNLDLMGSSVSGGPGDLTIRAVNPGSVTVNGGIGPAFFATGFSGNVSLNGLALNQNSGNPGGVVNVVDLSGVLLIQDCTFTNFGGDRVKVDTNGATQTTVRIQDSTFATTLDNRDAISVELFGTTNTVNLEVVDNTFSGLEDDGISFRADPTATGGGMTASITGDQFSGRTASGEDIELFLGNNTSANLIASATIENNTLTGPGIFTSITGEAIVVDVDGSATTATVDIIGNHDL